MVTSRRKHRVSTKSAYLTKFWCFLVDFNRTWSKRLDLACSQILFGKPCFQPELSKTWHISLSGQILQERSRLNQILALSYRFQCNAVKNLLWGCLQIVFAKQCFQRKLSKTLPISLSGQILQERSGLNQILAFSYRL